MKGKNIYTVAYKYYGVNYTKDCCAFDMGISYPGCLTIYFNGGAGRIVMELNHIEDFSARSIWSM